jgi:16S rRNA (uracil1498-N3)-methyltransferase
MAAPRFFVPAPLDPSAAGSDFALPDAPAHHALRVLRLAVGDALTLFTGAGGEFAATLVRAGKRDAWVRLDAFLPAERESALAVTLVQGIAATDAMDTIVRRAVELGVAAIQPAVSTRGARFPAGAHGDKRIAHWRQVAVAACEQCGRNRVPQVHDVIELADWLRARDAGRPGIVLDPEAATSIAALSAPAQPLDLLLGPEGGLTADEAARATRAGLDAARMGPRVLRTETASLAALAALNTLWGDFR